MKRQLHKISFMKAIIPIAAVAILLLAACNSSPKIEAESVKPINTDTLGLAEFQQWKSQNELAEYNEYKAFRADQAAYITPVKSTATKSTSTRSTAARRTSTNRSSGGSMSSESSNTAKAPAKKGWSKAAKGAVIGGVAGAGAGAVINKRNRAAGAVIGAVIGAGGGYVIGRKMDKNDGRVQ